MRTRAFIGFGLLLLILSPGRLPAQVTLEGLDLSDDEEEVEIDVGDAKVKEQDDQVTLEGLDLGDQEGGAEEEAAMKAAMKLAEEDNHEAASVAFHKILQNPKAAAWHPQAEYLLAKSLYRMGLYHAALHRFDRILSAGEAHKFFKVSLEWLFFISRKTVNESVVLEDIAAHADQSFPAQYRDEFLYLLSKYHFARGRALWEAGRQDEAQASYTEAGRLLDGVAPGSEFQPKAVFLKGLILYQAGRPNESLEQFKQVVRVLNPRNGSFRNDDLRDLAFMQLARLHYEHAQNNNAAFYYGRIRRDSDQWLRSLFEASWAFFRMGDYERSLGNMVTLHSPFFSDEYFPESLVLRAVIYYENCRYPEAKAIVDQFERHYGPVLSRLEQLATENRTPDAWYDLLADVQKKAERGRPTAEQAVLSRILKAALSDKEFAAMNASIREVEAEMDGIAERKQVFKFSELAREILEQLKEERQELIRKAGLMASAKLFRERENLKGLVGQGLRIRFETTTKEKEFLEKELQAGTRLQVVRDYGYSVAVSDEELYWPYEGEYWRDELGTYQYTLTKGCRERQSASASRE